MDFTSESFDSSDERTYSGNPDGSTWAPAESDTPNRYAHKSFQGGWFWKQNEEHTVIPADVLFDTYLKSVGRNTNLLIGMVIDDRGLFPEADAKIFAEFGGMVNDAFDKPIAELTQEELNAAESKYEYVLSLPKGSAPKYLMIMEDIAYGERVMGYTVNDGIAAGCCIGHKKIIELSGDTESVTVTITQVKSEPKLRSIAVY